MHHDNKTNLSDLKDNKELVAGNPIHVLTYWTDGGCVYDCVENSMLNHFYSDQLMSGNS